MSARSGAESKEARLQTGDGSIETAPSSRTVAMRVAIVFLGAAIAVKLGFIVVYGRHMRWVMDEFGQGYCGRFVPIGLYSKIDPIKTALPYPLYYAAIELGRSAVEVLQLWRAATTLAALLTVAATAFAAQRLYRNAQSTLFAVFYRRARTQYTPPPVPLWSCRPSAGQF